MYPKIERALVIMDDGGRERENVFFVGDHIEVLDIRGVWHVGNVSKINRNAVEIVTASGNKVYINFNYIDGMGGIKHGC